VGQQGERAAADEIDSRLVASREEEEYHRSDLALEQRVPPFLCGYQVGRCGDRRAKAPLRDLLVAMIHLPLAATPVPFHSIMPVWPGRASNGVPCSPGISHRR